MNGKNLSQKKECPHAALKNLGLGGFPEIESSMIHPIIQF